jgi:hypothetical protein
MSGDFLAIAGGYVSAAPALPTAPRPFIHDVIVALVDEGIPLRVIARSTRTDIDELRDIVTLAVHEGRLLSETRDDWPPGTKRLNRLPDGGTTADGRLPSLLCRLFGVTNREAMLLAALLKRPEATKDQLLNAMYTVAEDVPEIKIIDVFVCKLRKKLERHAITIETMWGRGYFIAADMRARALKMVSDFDNEVNPPPHHADDPSI